MFDKSVNVDLSLDDMDGFSNIYGGIVDEDSVHEAGGR